MVTIDDKFLTPKEIAISLKVHVRTIQRIINRGEIEAVKIGRQYRIPERVLDNYLKENTQFVDD